MLFGNFGFTYTTNPGIWINSNISDFSMFFVQVIVILLAIFAYFLLKYYQIFYRKSLLVDLAFAFFITAAIGNVIIDRLIFGYVRDYFINPIATSNLADICPEITLFLVIFELVTYPKARSLLKIGTPESWYVNARAFINFIRGKDRNNAIRGK